MKRLVLAVVTLVVVATCYVLPLAAQDAAGEGQKVFAREKCAMCHNAKMNSLGSVGTTLTAEQIRQWIENPTEAAKTSKSTSKMKMPKKNLTKADVDNLVAYLQTMKAS
jgi:cytochrome c553